MNTAQQTTVGAIGAAEHDKEFAASTPRFSAIAEELRLLRQWVCWRLEDRDGRKTKVPYGPRTHRLASATNPETWGSFDEATAAVAERGHTGIGFVFTAEDPYVGIDLDHVRDPATGTLAPWALELIRQLDSYAEVSQSGTGVHVIAKGKLPGHGRRKHIGSGGHVIEIYDQRRYFVMTGDALEGSPRGVEDRSEQINDIYRKFFGDEPDPSAGAAGVPPHRPAPGASADDQELIERASRAANGAKFVALWRGDWQGAGHDSQSDADAALLGILRFWTGGNKDRSLALFAKSGLVRDKWTERPDYREKTWDLVDHGEVYTASETIRRSDTHPSQPARPAALDESPQLAAVDEKLPAWPWHAYPKVLANLGQETVRTIGTCDELPGIGLLCLPSIALRNRYKVQIKPGHEQYGNLYGLALLAPGEKKSPVGKVLQTPFAQAQIEAHRRYADLLSQWKARERGAKARLETLTKKMQAVPAARQKEVEQQIAAEQKTIADRPHETVLLSNDATPEALARLMHQNSGALGVFSSEGRNIFAIAGGKYSRTSGADVSFWLAGYSGDYWRCDRASADREPLEIAEPVMAALVFTQPDVMETLGRSPELRDSGFLARWDFVCPESTYGYYCDGVIEPGTQEAYNKTITDILRVTADQGADERTAPTVITLTPEAFEAWRKFHNELVDLGRSLAGQMGGPFQQYLAKLPERIARIALVFHVVRHFSEKTSLGQITKEEIENAYLVVKAFLAHARRVFGRMSQSKEAAQARKLWEILDQKRGWLRKEREKEGLGAIEAVKPKDISRMGWAGVEDTEEAKTLLALLADKGVISEATTVDGRAPGQKHALYHLHPQMEHRADTK